MKNRRKFSIFISSTYEDLKKERQALVGVALENNFIPVGMEQFHAAPTSQWNVIKNKGLPVLVLIKMLQLFLNGKDTGNYNMIK